MRLAFRSYTYNVAQNEINEHTFPRFPPRDNNQFPISRQATPAADFASDRLGASPGLHLRHQ